MKGVFIILDGAADLPCKELNGKTPLEAASTPNLDWFAKQGVLGWHNSVAEGFIPESDSAIVSLLGNDFSKASRGQFEAIGAGIKMERGDLALRTNFATISDFKEGRIIERRVGRTLQTDEARVLAKAINKNVKLPCKFIFVPTIQHRGVLILRGALSDNITNTDPAYHHQEQVKSRKISEGFKRALPLDEEESSQYSADLINLFISQTYKTLDKHPLNIKRKEKGLLPANIILTRDAGSTRPELRKFEKWAAVTYMPVERGITLLSGMRNFSFTYPSFKGKDVYENLYEGLKKACSLSFKIIKKKFKKYDYFYVHFKETDVPGHDNLPLEKKKMLEVVDDLFFGKLKQFYERSNTKFNLLITADHATPCSKKDHSSDAVPFVFFNQKERDGKRLTEESCKKGKMKRVDARVLLKKTGFVK